MTEKQKHKCEARIVPRDRYGVWNPRNCEKNGIVERNGHWYCKIHDPVEVERRESEAIKKYHEEFEKSERARALAAAAEDLLAALEQVEWTNAVDGGTVCPWCGARLYDGHESYCPRQLAIAKAKGGKVK